MIDRIAHTAPPAARFDSPAPGQWELETAHHGLRPLSPFLRDSYRRAFEEGIVHTTSAESPEVAATRGLHAAGTRAVSFWEKH